MLRKVGKVSQRYELQMPAISESRLGCTHEMITSIAKDDFCCQKLMDIGHESCPTQTIGCNSKQEALVVL